MNKLENIPKSNNVETPPPNTKEKIDPIKHQSIEEDNDLALMLSEDKISSEKKADQILDEINEEKQPTETQDGNKNNTEKEKEKIFSTYKPEFDQQLGIPFNLEKDEWAMLQSSLESSYGPAEGADMEDLKTQLNYIKNLLNKKFNDDATYGLLSSEVNKLEEKKDNLLKKINKKGRRGKKSEKLEREASDVSNKWSDYSRILYKTTRGFLESRIESMKKHLSKMEKKN